MYITHSNINIKRILAQFHSVLQKSIPDIPSLIWSLHIPATLCLCWLPIDSSCIKSGNKWLSFWVRNINLIKYHRNTAGSEVKSVLNENKSVILMLYAKIMTVPNKLIKIFKCKVSFCCKKTVASVLPLCGVGKSVIDVDVWVCWQNR